MGELILLYTKRVHFNFDGKTYIEINGEAMGSLLSPMLLRIFTAELEDNLIHKTSYYIMLFVRKDMSITQLLLLKMIPSTM